MKEVNSLEDAMEFFLRNSGTNVICIKDGDKMECDCYPKAKEFYGEE